METPRLDHVGIAVKSIAEALPFYQRLVPGAHVEYEDVPEMKVRVAKLKLANTCLELIEPQGGEAAITKFLEKRGEGIHHICLEVRDVAAAAGELKKQGYSPVYEMAKPGSGGMLVNFLSPRDTRGVLIELNSRDRKG